MLDQVQIVAMHKVVELLIRNARDYVEGRKPKEGLGVVAHDALGGQPFYALVPKGTEQDRAEALSEGGLTSRKDTLPVLIDVFKRASKSVGGCSVCVQMLLAKDSDFPIGEGFEIESRPYRLNVNNVIYVSAPLAVIDDGLLRSFINLDIGFETAIILLDRVFSEVWFQLDANEKRKSVLSMAYDAYDGESFVYSLANVLSE